MIGYILALLLGTLLEIEKNVRGEDGEEEKTEEP